MSHSICAIWLTDFLLDARILHQLSSKLKGGEEQIWKLWQSQNGIRGEMEENFFFSADLSMDEMVRG
jgi:hypothetical protein